MRVGSFGRCGANTGTDCLRKRVWAQERVLMTTRADNGGPAAATLHARGRGIELRLRKELPLAMADGLVALERDALVFEPQPRAPTRAAERVAQHANAMARDEARVVHHGPRKVAQLDPSFRAPPHELDFRRVEMLGPH